METQIGKEVQFNNIDQELPRKINEWKYFAEKNLPHATYEYIARGSGEEKTLKANRKSFDHWMIVPDVLRNTDIRDMSVTILGKVYKTPLLISPIGVQKIVHPAGELETCTAAAKFGIPFILSNAASCSIEEVADVIPASPKWFQVYFSKNREVSLSQIKRAEVNNYEALVITVDTALLGLREYDVINEYSPLNDGLGSGNYISDPVFIKALKERGISERKDAIKFQMEIFENPTFTWQDIILLQKETSLPIFIKGVLSEKDALKAVEIGIDGLIVSNHGGRQLDHCISSLEALEDIVKVVNGKIPVLFDSGIRRGTDILKAMALGADAVLIGRPILYGLVAGERGVTEVLKQILKELDISMSLSGISNLAHIERSLIRKK